MPIPTLSHVSLVALNSLSDRFYKSGQSIRDVIKDAGHNQSSPAFYQLMSRLERENMVVGKYEEVHIDGARHRIRAYRLTTLGMKAVEDTIAFYEKIA